MADVVVVNEKDEVIGTMPKAEAHKNGTLHRIVVVYVENEKGEILVQERMDGFLDHSAAGHVDPGESYEVAGRRELFEELGIEAGEFKFIGNTRAIETGFPGQQISHVFNVYVCKGVPGKLQEDEVKGVYWAKPQNILEEMRKDNSKFCVGFVESLKIYLANPISW